MEGHLCIQTTWFHTVKANQCVMSAIKYAFCQEYDIRRRHKMKRGAFKVTFPL